MEQKIFGMKTYYKTIVFDGMAYKAQFVFFIKNLL